MVFYRQNKFSNIQKKFSSLYVVVMIQIYANQNIKFIVDHDY